MNPKIYPCEFPDCQKSSVRTVVMSINGKPRAFHKVCDQHYEAAREDDPEGWLPDAFKLEAAKAMAMDHNSAGMPFDLCGNRGVMHCTWLDPALGLFIPHGESSFMMLRDAYDLGMWITNMQIRRPE